MLKNKIIVCLGNGKSDADKKAELVALEYNIKYNGLLDISSIKPGCYHTSVYDISLSELSDIMSNIKELIVLNQEKELYKSDDDYYSTIQLAKRFENKILVTFKNVDMRKTIDDDLEKNKSFCILPWIHHFEVDGHLRPCCFANHNANLGKAGRFVFNNEKRKYLKELMLNQKSIEGYCKNCIDLEKKGHSSPRKEYTRTWFKKLNLNSISDIINADIPILSYDIRRSNLCNLMCRTCNPDASNLIAQEDQILKIHWTGGETLSETVGLDYILNENTFEAIYFAGGEPTFDPKIEEFLKNLINLNRTDKEITFNTNAFVLTKKFKNIIRNFSNLRFIVSIDGFEQHNDYIRWGSKWESIIENLDYLLKNNFFVSINIVVSIYSIMGLPSLLKFLENSKYKLNFNLSFLIEPRYQSPYLIPNKKLVLKLLKEITTLNIYKNNIIIYDKINELLDYYTNRHNIDYDLLEEFFNFNDTLDKSRNTKLADYIPELEECRNYLTKQI